MSTDEVRQNDLGGELPPAYSAWTQLLEFRADGNSLQGPLPFESRS